MNVLDELERSGERSGQRNVIIGVYKRRRSGRTVEDAIAAIFVVVVASIIILFLGPCSPAHAEGEFSEAYIDKVVAGIYRVEGGKKASVPYGILSRKVTTLADARQTCRRTVRNNIKRWKEAQRTKGDARSFLTYLADRYCPHSADAEGNKNWKKNIRKFVKGIK